MEDKAQNAAPSPVCRRHRRGGKFAGIAVLALAVLLLVLVLTLDFTVAAAIRHGGPVFTGTPVELRAVHVNVFTGRVSLIGFKIRNPEGFSQTDAFKLEKFVCRVNLPSVITRKVVIEEITVKGMRINYELGLSGSNLAKIQRNLESASGGKESVPAEDPSPGPGRKVVIRELQVEGMVLAMGELRMPLPPVKLTDLGDGRSMDEIISLFYTAMMESVTEVISSETAKNLEDKASDLGRSAEKAGKKLMKNIQGLFK